MKSDKEFNIRFVKLVCKYPTLYDTSLESYANRLEVKKIWKEIGEILHKDATRCAAKWSVLRRNYHRSICGKSGQNRDVRKSYYLSKHMQFLLPYVRWKTAASKTVEKDTESEVVESAKDKQELTTDEEYSADEVESANEQDFNSDYSPSIPSSSKPYKRKIFLEEQRHCSEAKSTVNSDMAFFQSLLPLVTKLNDSENMRFRISVMQSLQKLIDKDVPQVEPSNVPMNCNVELQPFVVKLEKDPNISSLINKI